MRARPPRRVLAGALIGAAVAALGLLAPALAGAETVTRYFYAHEEAFVVPQGVTSIHVVAVGGHGGSDALGFAGGEGARVSATLSVTSGSTLYVHVGGPGANGGAGEGGGGGGASDVRTAPLSAGLFPDPRLIVAAGGGGAGGVASNEHLEGARGGNAEEAGWSSELATGGEPGTQTAGGEGGLPQSSACPESDGEDGTLERGGLGGACSEKSGGSTFHGGAGGDGYYGGGGGGAGGGFSSFKTTAEAGGGGGSSLVPAGGSESLAGSETAQVQISYVQPGNPPAVVTGAASSVLETSATVNGTVDPEGLEVTSCTFEYGETEAYGQLAACSQPPGSGVSPVGVSAPLSGLARGTTYHYRLTAANARGTSHGADATFTTFSQGPPTLSGISPTEGPLAGGTSVTITGTELENATAVSFGSTAARSFKVESSTTIVAVSPEGTGTVDVTVTTPGGVTSTSSADHYTYVAPPAAAFTEYATGITQTAAVVNGFVPSTTTFTECHFEYGISVSYGSSVPCSVRFSLGGGRTGKFMDAPVSGLTPGTTYHFRVSVSNAGGTTTGADESFTTASAPEYGRCIKLREGEGVPLPGEGLYENSSCTLTGGTKAYEWYAAFAHTRGLVKAHFTTKLKELTEVKFQDQNGKLIACKGAPGSGEYTGDKTIGNVTVRFTGCHLEATSCQSGGAAEGEVVSSVLQGTLGVIKKSSEGAIKNVIGTDLRPVSGEVFAAFTCGAANVTIAGAVIGEVKRDAMTATGQLKFVQAKSRQKYLRFEGGPEETLTIKIGEEAPRPAGLSASIQEVNEEKIEVDSVV